jgi:hypothetical protein
MMRLEHGEATAAARELTFAPHRTQKALLEGAAEASPQLVVWNAKKGRAVAHEVRCGAHILHLWGHVANLALVCAAG